MASYDELQFDMEILLENINGSRNGTKVDLQLAAELGKTLLERNKELENLLRSHQRKCEDQKQEIEYLTKQNLALKEVNDSRMQIYETLDVSIRDLEIEKHSLMVQTSNDKKVVKSLKQNIDSLELRCEELSKQIEEITHQLEQEKRKNERLRDNVQDSPAPSQKTASTVPHRDRHTSSSASEPENEEACTPTNPLKSFTNCGQNSTAQHPFSNFSQDFSSIQPIYSLDSHDSGFKTGSSSNSAEHDELLKVMTELEDAKQQYVNEHLMVAELEHQLAVLAQENQKLQSRLVQANTLDEMKSVHEELSFLEEVRQGQMCTRCLKIFDSRMVPTENTSYIGTEGDDDDDRSLMDLLNNTVTQTSPPVYRSAVTIKDADEVSQAEEDPRSSFNPYKDLVEKYEKLLELKRTGPKQQPHESKEAQPQSLHDELLNSGDFSSFNTKFTSDDEKEKKSSTGTRTDFSETETTSSGFSDETSTKATQTDGNPASFLFSIADGEDCKFTIYDDAAPIENRFRDRPVYKDLFKEIFSVLKKAAENKDEGDKLPLLDDDKPESTDSKVPPVTPAAEDIPCDFDTQSVMSSAMSENSVAVSECITKTERKKVKSHKKQAAKEELENKPPSAVGVIGGKLVTPYNRMALDLMAITAKKRSRRSRHRSRDKYAGGRDSSVTSNASSISNIETVEEEPQNDEEAGDQSTLTRNKKSRKRRELLTLSTLGAGSDWNGDSLTVYNRNAKKANPQGYYCKPSTSGDNTSEIEFKHSAAHSELRKLKKLDLSYAEVLRKADRSHRRWK